MKKRIYNFFLMFLLVFAIFSCDNKPHDVIYTITLNAEDSTSKGDEKLYYNATTGLYYSSSQMTTPITSITKPEKVWNINIVGNGDRESLSKSFTFVGYKDPSVTSKDANEDMFIGGDGKIDKSKKVNKDITLVADWGSQDTIRVSVSELLSKVNGTSLIVPNYTLKQFIYQAKSYPADEPNNYITISDNNAEIIIDQVLNGGKQLKFEAPGATTPGSLNSIYYKYEAKDGKNWFTSSTYNLPIEKLSEAELPKKEYTIELHRGDGEKDPDPLVSSDLFLGYVYQVGNQTYKYVERDGTINTPRASSIDPIKDSSTEGPITAVATWRNSQTLVTLPSVSRNGWVLSGWMRDPHDETCEIIPAEQERLITYNGDSQHRDENNIIKLYAKWDKVTPISLQLRDISVSNKVYGTIYYQRGRGWFSDPDCTKPITTFPVPTRSSTIQFEAGRSDKKNPENATYEWGFDGFKSNDEKVIYISPSGAIAKNATLSSDSIAYAFWNTNSSVNLPGKEYGFDTDTTYEFQGWSDDGGKTILTDTTYRPETNSSENIVLNAIWKDLRVFVLTLDNKYMEGDVKTNISKLYYKPTTTYKYVYNESTKQSERVLDKNEGWYKDRTCEDSFDRFNESELPQRVYHIYYNINRTLAEDVKASVGEGVDYVWQFGGYGNYIGSEGQILTDNENNKPVRLSGDDTAEIKWIKPAKVVLPNLYIGTDKDGNNGTHNGWKERDGEKLSLEREGDGWLYEPKTEQYTVNLEPTWDMSDVKYTLTLNSLGATNENEIYSVIKYSINDRQWYDENDNVITSLVNVNANKKLPEKKFNVIFDVVQTGTEPALVNNIVSQYPFMGYNGYVDENGRIIASSLTKQHETTTARWGTATPITLPDGPTKTNFKFVSWCERTEDGTLKPVSSPYTPNGETVLYAKWQDLNKYTVSLNHNGATEGTYNELVYWDNSWHASSSSTAVLTKINIPKKEYVVNFNVNNSQASSIKSMTSEFPFGGYRDTEDEELFIDVTGSIIEGKTLTNDSVRLIAVWRTQKGIVLPTPVAPGWIFKGWTKDKDCQDKLDKGENVVWEKEVGQISTPYNPDENGITLYAGWVREESYELKLNEENKLEEKEDLGITYSVPSIYYFERDGWYLDKDGKIRVNKISIPRRIWTVDFVPNLAGATKPERQEANFPFLGYGNYIDGDGIVNQASSITAPATSIAQWDRTPSVTLPYYGPENPELTYDKNYTFLGWSESPNGSVNDTLKDVNNNKASSYIPKVVKTTLYGVWADNNPYTLTLDNNGATNSSETESSIDYMVGTDGGGRWYVHGDLHEDTTKIDALKVKPKKEWTAMFDVTGPNGEIFTAPGAESSTWEFLGYSDGNKQYIDSSGAIVSDASISENTSVKASWGNQTAINLSVKPRVFNNNIKYEVDGKELYFNGWALEKNPGVALPATYYPNASDVEDDNTIKLVAIYTEEQVYNVELVDDGATEKGTSEVYYKPNDKNWHPQADTQTVISGITSPKKVWTIVYNSNKDGVSNPTNGSYVFNFEGYYSISDGTESGSINENDQYIDSNGNFISGKKPSSNMTLKARWGQPSDITLPSSELTKPGFEFLGWSQSSTWGDGHPGSAEFDPKGDEFKNGADFKNLVDTGKIAIDNNGTIILYGVWKPNNVYTLTLNPNGGEQTVGGIYYRVGDGWYLDEACTTPFTKLTIPKKTFYVSFETMLPGVDSVDQLQSEAQFVGYRISDNNVYIDAQGDIANAVSLDKNETAEAQWVNPSAITLPAPSTIEGYDFIGWCKENPSYETPSEIYAPRTSYVPKESHTFYAYWENVGKYELTLDDNGATSSASVSKLYYSVKNKAWYSNEALTGQIVEKITPPQKRVTVEFNSNAPDVPKQNNIVIEWKFEGYDDFIDEEGNIKKIDGSDFVKLSSNRTVKANWTIDVEHGRLPEENVMKRSNFEFEGWMEEQDGQVTVVNPYNPTDDKIKEENGVITLYAKWRDNSVKRLTLDSNGATTVTTSAIYFKRDTEGRKRWYSTGNNPEDKNIITGIEIPKKEVTVNFVVSSKYGNTPQPITFSSEFEGYYYVDDLGNMDESDRWIGANGMINEEKDLYEIGDKTVRAKWANPPEYALPSPPDYPGFEFLGWSTTEGATTPDPGFGYKDTISLTTEIQPLHDVWKLKNVYTLTLNSGTTSSLGTRRLYYLTDDTWYYNWSGNQTDPPTSKATAITIPKKFYEVTLNYNYGNDAQGNPIPGQPEDVKTSTAVTFLGYGGAISQSGVIVPSYTIQGDTTLNANWGVALSIRLPDVTSIKRDDYECVGWALNKNETDDKNMKNDTYAPGSDGETLYAQWVSTKVYRVSFINNGATSSATSNNNAVNRLYYRVSDGKWYKSITDKTAITSFTAPQKAQSVSFITMLQGVSIQQAAYTHTFRGYHTTQEESHDRNDKEVISVDSGIAYIDPTWVPDNDITIYAWWKEPDNPISLENANKTMKEAALKSEKYFVGWSRYADANTESILQDTSATSRDPDEDPLGLLIKARKFTPTASQTTLYAILVDTTTYVVELYNNNTWSSTSPTSGTPSKRLYYRPSVNYQDPWFEVNGSPSDEELKKALQSATETIIANINATTSSSYPLRRWSNLSPMPTKQATATLNQQWPKESLGAYPTSYTENPGEELGWFLGYYNSAEGYVSQSTASGMQQKRDETFRIDWGMSSSGYYFYKNGEYGDQWITAQGSLDTSVVSNISNVATTGTDSDGRPTHTISLVSKFTTTTDTWNKFNEYNIFFSDDLIENDDTKKTGYPYRLSGWSTEKHTDDDPSSNRENIITADGTFEPVDSSFDLYGSWYKKIDETLKLNSGTRDTTGALIPGSSAGSEKLHYVNSGRGGFWYYEDEEGVQYTLRTEADQDEYAKKDPTISPDDTGHIVLPEQQYTITFKDSRQVADTLKSSGQPPTNPGSVSASAKFVGYKNPDYKDDKVTDRKDYEAIPYVIDEKGYLGSNLFRKDSSIGERELDKVSELVAEWDAEEGQTIDATSISDDNAGGMHDEGYNHVGWSEIYDFDKDGKVYFEAPTEGTTVEWKNYTYEVVYPLEVGGVSYANKAALVTYINNTADAAKNDDGNFLYTGTIHEKVKKLFQDDSQVGDGKIFASTEVRMALANAYYYVAAGTRNYTPTHSTTLYNVWAENYTLAVLAPQNLSTSAITPIFGTSSDAKVETITLSSNTVTFTSSYIAPSSTSYTITYPVGYKNDLNEFAKPSNTGALVYLALFHGDGSEKTLSKTVYFDESSFGTDDSTLMTAFRGSGVSGASGLLFFNRKIATGSEDAAYVVEKKIFDVNGHLIAIGIRVKGYIESTGTYSMNSYEKLIRGGKEMESTKGTYAKIAFEDVVSRVAMSNGGLEAPYPNGSLTNTSSMRENRYIFDLYSSNSTVFTSVDSIEITSKPDITDFGMTVYSSTSSVITLSLNGRFSVEGNYTVKFKVKGKYKENNVEYQFTSHELTLTFAIAPNENTFDFNDKKEEFSNYFTTSGTTITNTTYPFKQGLTYILPEGITAISGMPGGSGNTQNGVFNSDANGETGKYGNYLNNANITRMEIPDSVTTLGVGTFHSRDSASNLEWISLSDNITVIPAQCFTETKIKSLKFPKKLQTIGQSAFYNCGYWLTGDQICGTFPKTLTTIVAGAFGRYAGAPSYLPLFAYDGTIAEWNSNVTIGSGNSNYFRVKCSDGIVTISRAN